MCIKELSTIQLPQQNAIALRQGLGTAELTGSQVWEDRGRWRRGTTLHVDQQLKQSRLTRTERGDRLAPPEHSPTPRAMAEWLRGWRTTMSLALRLLRQKPVRIGLSGDVVYSRAIYDAFTARHPKFPLTRRKSFGAALWDLDIPFPDLFTGARLKRFRQRVRRARKLGYTVRRFDPQEYLSGIMCVHASSAIRQGQAIEPDYLDSVKVTAYCARPGAWYGVFGAGQSLRGYCHVPIVGDCGVINRIMGHAESLGDDIVYLLVHEVLGEMHRVKSRTGHPRWVMYDMFLGGSHGLRDFKHRCGFEPQRVAWYWRQDREG